MEHIDWLNQLGKPMSVIHPINMFLEAISFMEGTPNVEIHTSLKEFSRLTKKLDDIRNENFIETFLEIAELHNAHKVGFALDISDFDKMYQLQDYHFAQTIYRTGRAMINRQFGLLAPFIDVETIAQ